MKSARATIRAFVAVINSANLTAERFLAYRAIAVFGVSHAAPRVTLEMGISRFQFRLLVSGHIRRHRHQQTYSHHEVSYVFHENLSGNW